MSTADYETARAVIQDMLNGGPPPTPLPELNGWSAFVGDLVTAHGDGGTLAVRRAFDAAARANRQVAQMFVRTPPAEATPPGCPALPEAAQAIYQHTAPCGHWLDAYVDFAAEAAPMTPRAFHEAAGLFAVSAAVARRLCLRTGTGYLFPNLFILQIAPPALYKKTTGLNLMTDLLEAAGIDHLLLPHSVTPQSLMSDLSLNLPPAILNADEPTRQAWLETRAFAAQRGWLLDEAAGLMESFRRDYNTGLIDIVLQLFDCKRKLTEQTASRGLVTVERAYLSLLGATTPDAIRKHLNDRELWGRGLWSRFALVAPDSPPVYAPRPPSMHLPHELVQTYRRVFDRFSRPRASIITPRVSDGDGNDKAGQPFVQLDGVSEPEDVALAEGVAEALDRYARAVGFDLLRQRGAVDQLFHSYYDRLGLQAYKVAILLGVIDAEAWAPITVELRHVARAVEIVERWRAGLHRIWSTDLADDDVELGDRVLDQLGRHREGLTARELCQLLHRKSAVMAAALDLLEKGGKVESSQAGRTVVWTSVASVAKRSNDAATPSSASGRDKARSVAV